MKQIWFAIFLTLFVLAVPDATALAKESILLLAVIFAVIGLGWGKRV